MSESEYQQIFEQVCAEFDVAFNAEAFEFLLGLHRRTGRPTVAAYPRDLLAQLRDTAAYRERPLDLTPELIDWAWHNYFATQ